MNLLRVGREMAHWAIATTDPLGGFKVQLVPNGLWFNATYANNVVSLLVKGPNYPPSFVTDDGLGALVSATCQPVVATSTGTELIARQGSWIILV